MQPYYADDTVTLYLGDCREVLPGLGLVADAVVADPPYGETVAEWDRWPDGWVKALDAAVPASASLWCFGTAGMFLDYRDEFAGWKFSRQEALWLKRNGSGPGSADRLLRVHEWAYHWYRGRWSDLHHEWERERVYAADKSARSAAAAASHRGPDRTTAYVDDGYRQPRSVRVIEAPSVRYQKRHQDEKPVKVVAELVRECTPPGGTVLDPGAGSGPVAIAARMLGRRAVLIESLERHCEEIVKRLQADVLPIPSNP
jgi:site-specific DNA-methyltransferase (adenine-specific)